MICIVAHVEVGDIDLGLMALVGRIFRFIIFIDLSSVSQPGLQILPSFIKDLLSDILAPSQVGGLFGKDLPFRDCLFAVFSLHHLWKG